MIDLLMVGVELSLSNDSRLLQRKASLVILITAVRAGGHARHEYLGRCPRLASERLKALAEGMRVLIDLHRAAVG